MLNNYISRVDMEDTSGDFPHGKMPAGLCPRREMSEKDAY